MQTDTRITRLPQIRWPKEYSTIETAITYFKKAKENAVIYVQENRGLEPEYADYIQGQIPLIGERFYKILSKYAPDTFFHRVVLVEKQSGKQSHFYCMIPPEIECSEKLKSTYDTTGQVKEFVLDASKVGTHKLFMAKDYQRKVIVRLDVAESILRREPNGIWFEPVKQ